MISFFLFSVSLVCVCVSVCLCEERGTGLSRTIPSSLLPSYLLQSPLLLIYSNVWRFGVVQYHVKIVMFVTCGNVKIVM